jgi:pyruvate dehydrogenase E2 component (dihydrolipoamide acetyltransferase)
MEEGTIAKWHKKVGDRIRSGDLLVEVATDKATVEYNALDGGYLRKILLAEGASATINQPIAVCTEKADESIEGFPPAPETPKEAPKKAVTAAPVSHAAPAATTPTPAAFIPEPPLESYKFPFSTHSPSHITASPMAKQLAKQKGLDLASIQGSGPGGRITSRDLDLAQPDQPVSFSQRAAPTITPGTFEELSLTPMRKAIAQRLQQSKSFIPHIYIRQEINAEALVATREQLKQANLKVSINDFVIRAVALALREHPHINSGFNGANQSILRFKTVDISVAVSIDQGLITPIIRHADYKNIGEIAAEVKELATRAKAHKLEPHEYRGGSFTISNMGMYGVTEFAAIINPPQAAILAVGAIEECLRLHGEKVLPGKKMNLTLSCDHRVIDGSDGAQFIKALQKYLENPALLLV